MTEQQLYKKHAFPFSRQPLVYLSAFIILVFSMAINPLAFLGFLIVFTLLFCWQYFRITFTITDERLTLEEGNFSKTVTELYYNNIANIKMRQNFIERLLNLGMLEVASAGTSDYEIIVAGIPEPYNAKEIIERQKARIR